MAERSSAEDTSTQGPKVKLYKVLDTVCLKQNRLLDYPGDQNRIILKMVAVAESDRMIEAVWKRYRRLLQTQEEACTTCSWPDVSIEYGLRLGILQLASVAASCSFRLCRIGDKPCMTMRLHGRYGSP